MMQTRENGLKPLSTSFLDPLDPRLVREIFSLKTAVYNSYPQNGLKSCKTQKNLMVNFRENLETHQPTNQLTEVVPWDLCCVGLK